mgnify:CR=1 FL=1
MADASTDQPGLLESALAFIRGETVAKSSLLTAQARATQLESELVKSATRIAGLDADNSKATQALAVANANIADLTAKNAALAEEVATLKATAFTAARQASTILSGIGVQAVKTETATARDKAGEQTFADLVVEQVNAGQSKIKAIQIVMATNPEAYKAYLRTGGKI